MSKNRYYGKSQYLEILKIEYPGFEQFIPKLTEIEQVVIRQRLEGHYLHDVGAAIGVTRERVRQIEAKAARKLRWYTQYGKVTV